MATPRTIRHDIRGNSFFRVVRLNVMNKLVPLGNYRHGVGLRPALVLLVLHYFSRPLFHLLIRYEHQLHRIYQKLRRQD